MLLNIEIAELFQEINQRRVNMKQSPRNNSTPSSPARGSMMESSKAAVNQKYPSLPSEWMKTPRTSFRDTKQPKRKKRLSNCHDSNNSADESDEEEESFSFAKFSKRKFILAEMLGIGQPAATLEHDAAESIDNFLSVPYKLECLVTFGCFVALDSFLYVITYLPIRFIFAIYIFLDEMVLPSSLKIPDGSPSVSTGYLSFPRNRLYDFMKGLLLIIGCYALSLVDMSRVYHYIRMQNTLKLYALTGMMEIIDKLLCSFGIDILDSLFVKTRPNKHGSGTVFTFVVAAVYVVLHSSLYFLHMATLTVAINNQDQSLVTVLILNNFAEIKSSVLKKFDSGNLFQLACSDITERFKMLLFYTLIILVGLAQARDMAEAFRSFFTILLAMVICEMCVDWTKHAFITKFNAIKSSCYIDYSRTLRNDILNGHNDKITLDHSYSITKRLGMSQIPLGVVFFKFLFIGINSSRLTTIVMGMTQGQLLCSFLFCFSTILGFKVILSVGLIYYTAYMNSKEHKEERKENKRRMQEEGSKESDSSRDNSLSPSIDHNQSVEALSNIERYTMLRGRINA